MSKDSEDFRHELHQLVEEIQARVEEVGLEQAAEEYWQKAQLELDQLCEELEQVRENLESQPEFLETAEKIRRRWGPEAYRSFIKGKLFPV